MNLTVQTIKNAKPTTKTRKLFDGGGLYLEVSPKGRKWWRLKYRFGGKEKKLSLGVYPEVTLKEARDRRYQARKLLDDSIDPSEHRQSIREKIRTQTDNTLSWWRASGFRVMNRQGTLVLNCASDIVLFR